MGEDRIVYNLEAMNEYISWTRKQCAALSDRQSAVGSAYNRLSTSWNDNIFSGACKIINETACNIKRIYDELRSAAAKIVKLFNELCDYNNCSSNRLFVRIPDFTTKTLRGAYMNNGNRITDHEVMYEFLRQLKAYVYDTQKSVNDIIRHHDDMARYWRGKQYDEMKRNFDDIGYQIEKQLKRLTLLLEYVRQKYVEACAIAGVTPRPI